MPTTRGKVRAFRGLLTRHLYSSPKIFPFSAILGYFSHRCLLPTSDNFPPRVEAPHTLGDLGRQPGRGRGGGWGPRRPGAGGPAGGRPRQWPAATWRALATVVVLGGGERTKWGRLPGEPAGLGVRLSSLSSSGAVSCDLQRAKKGRTGASWPAQRWASPPRPGAHPPEGSALFGSPQRVGGASERGSICTIRSIAKWKRDFESLTPVPMHLIVQQC